MGLPEGVHHTAQEAVPDRDRKYAAGRTDDLSLLKPRHLAEHDGADRVLVEVEGQSARATFELEELVNGDVRQACDPGDAVTDVLDAPYLFARDPGREALQVAPQDVGDVSSVDAQLSHLLCRVLSMFFSVFSGLARCQGRPSGRAVGRPRQPYDRARGVLLSPARGGDAGSRRSRRRR